MKLVEVAKLNMGQSPPSASYNDIGEGLPFYQGKADFGFINPIPRKYCNEPSKIAEKGDILISVRAPVGPVNIANDKCCIGRGLAAIKASKADQIFLYFNLIYQESFIASLGTGSTFKAINKSQLENVIIPNIPLPEQHKIAHILSTVQKAMEQQDKLIHTTTELKKTLMQKLFTEGTRGEPQKETEIGLVPESWEVVRIENIVNETKIRDPCKEPNKEFIYVDVSSVSNEFFRIENATKLLGKDAPSRARKIIRNGDVIFATVRPTLKRIAKITPEFDNQICSTGYCVLQPKTNQITQEFLYQYLQTDFFISRIEKLQRGASYPAVRDTDVKNMLIPLPSITEQIEIGKVLKSLDEKSLILIRKKQTLTALFKTLLHELMTGQRRVHELDFEVLQSRPCSKNIDNKPQVNADKCQTA